MSDERRLAATGMPLEDAISNCHAMRRDGTLEEFVQEQEQKHVCKCGGVGICPGCDCPKKGARR